MITKLFLRLKTAIGNTSGASRFRVGALRMTASQVPLVDVGGSIVQRATGQHLLACAMVRSNDEIRLPTLAYRQC